MVYIASLGALSRKQSHNTHLLLPYWEEEKISQWTLRTNSASISITNFLYFNIKKKKHLREKAVKIKMKSSSCPPQIKT